MTQSVEIPRTQEELRLAQFALDHAGEAAIRLPQRRVLVVDNEAMVREFATDVLSVAGIEVDLAVDGAEAVEIYRRGADVSVVRKVREIL